MPPFLAVKIATGGANQAEEGEAIALRLERDLAGGMTRERREGVETRPHVEGGAITLDERQIDGDAARMRRAPPRIGQELGVGTGVPQHPLRFGRPESIEDPQAQAERACKVDGAAQPPLGVAVETAGGAAIDRP